MKNKGLFADTLSKRLLLLMWAALVGSHLLAYTAVRMVYFPAQGPQGGSMLDRLPPLPPLPSLPPTPGLPQAADAPGPQGQDANAPRRPPPPGDAGVPPSPHPEGRQPVGPAPGHERTPGPRQRPPALPWDALLLDYGVRFAAIAAAAWFGSRWLSAPMRRLVRASQSLGDSFGGQQSPAPLDERAGTAEVREAAEVFNRMARQLREQFQSRGLMVAAISHDLRTPLTRLRLRLESMGDDPELQQRSVADIREMNELIDNVLEVFRLEGPGYREPPQNADVNALVQSLADDLAEQGQPVAFTGHAVVADIQPGALRRVVANLIGNALRYGGRAEVCVMRSEKSVHIVVEDQGPGIPPAELEAVFQPFYRVDSARGRDTGGTGLGLYIARDLTQKQGGTLTLANRPQGGLRAEVTLPLRG
jgi:signal transduction histidine kinase